MQTIYDYESSSHRYEDRKDAGQKLADKLSVYRNEDVVVLALPRGGVVLGAEVARSLWAPLGLVLVKKITHPSNPEFAVGAVAEGEKPIYHISDSERLDHEWLEEAENRAYEQIKLRREMYFNEEHSPPSVKGKTVIIVDDGIATGLTMEAAVQAVRKKEPKKIIVAVPVASADSVAELEEMADEVIVLDDPNNFMGAVGAHYKRFPRVDDNEVTHLLWDIDYGM